MKVLRALKQHATHEVEKKSQNLNVHLGNFMPRSFMFYNIHDLRKIIFAFFPKYFSIANALVSKRSSEKKRKKCISTKKLMQQSSLIYFIAKNHKPYVPNYIF